MKMDVGGVLLRLVSWLAVVILVIPLVVVIALSFTTRRTLEWPPTGFTLHWYAEILENPQFVEAFVTSLQLALAAAFLATALGTATALGIFRYSFFGRNALLGLALSPLMLPQLVLAIALLMWLSQLHLNASFTGLMIAHIVVVVPYVVRLVLVGLERVDRNIERAAAISGASPFAVFRRVTIWLIFPGMFAGAAFAFIMSFDNLVVSLFLTSPRFTTLPVEIYAYLEYADDPLITAISSVVIAQILLMLLVIEKTVGFAKGFTQLEH